jgi:hypothetical protein
MRLEKELLKLIRKAVKKDSSTDITAKVLRVEGSTAWVHIDGGAEETPVQMSIACKEGDNVRVRINNGSAYVIGNTSAPPTDDAVAIVANNTANIASESAKVAKATADDAIEQAGVAASAAASAQQSADAAQQSATAAGNAASQAQTKANQAAQAASAAQNSADAAANAASVADGKAVAAGNAAAAAQSSANAAQASADNAGEYASRALGNLSTVQSVAETLAWITAHGTMTITTDTSLDPTHVYFVRDANGDYTVGNYKYSVVSEPDVSQLSNYYVLSIDESLNNYVATHLAVTNEGLWIIPASNGFKVLIATGAGSTYTTAGTYIIDGNGNTIGEFTANAVTIGSRLSPYSTGLKSMVLGVDCVAGGNNSFAEGRNTQAIGTESHAEGYVTFATGIGSHAQGRGTTASGNYSHAGGYGSTAEGFASHAGGYNTIAGTSYQAVFGAYNNNKSNTLFEVGNGTSVSARSNAFEVTSDGSIRTGKTGYKVAFGAKEQTVAAGSWTASSYTSPSGTVYGYKYAVPITGLTGESFVDITITSGSYIGAYCVESDSTTGYAVIRTATLPSAALGFRIYYTLV